MADNPTSKEHILFIVNPISGGKNKDSLSELISAKFGNSNYSYSIIFTEYKGHASKICNESNAEIIVAVGGDGTINEVASCLINTKKVLGIIPCGSGDGFARHIGVSHNFDEATRVIIDHNIQTVDTGIINGMPFLCTCGIGLDAEVSHDFSNSPDRGLKTYLNIGLRKLWKYQAKHYSLDADNYHFEGEAELITIGNANQWGNNAYITPNASIQDHLLDITIAKPFPVFELPHISLMLMSKHIYWDPHIITRKTKSVTLNIQGDVNGHIDGDPIVLNGPIKIHVQPNSLRVLTPNNVSSL